MIFGQNAPVRADFGKGHILVLVMFRTLESKEQKIKKVNFCNNKKIREKVEEMGGFYYQLPCKNVIQQKF